MAATDAKRQPWLKFYTSDWRGDAALHSCSLAARGLWIEMLGLMHEAVPYGHLLLNGQPLDARQLSRPLGATAREITELLAELDRAGVFSRNDNGVIFSRRMVADREKAERDRKNGSSGGNPQILRSREPKDKIEDKRGVNPTDSPGLNPADKGGVKAHNPEVRIYSSLRSASDEMLLAQPPSRSTTSSAPDLPNPTAKRLWDEGKPTLGRLLGIPIAKAGSQLGKLRNAFGDDDRLLQTIIAAEQERPAAPFSWIYARANAAPKSRPGTEKVCCNDPAERWLPLADGMEIDSGTGQQHPVVGGYYLDVVAAQVAEAAKLSPAWQGDWNVLAGWLREGIPAEQIVSRIERVAGKKDYPAIGSLRFFDAIVRERRAA